jgi:hypothetical protein
MRAAGQEEERRSSTWRLEHQLAATTPSAAVSTAATLTAATLGCTVRIYFRSRRGKMCPLNRKKVSETGAPHVRR